MMRTKILIVFLNLIIVNNLLLAQKTLRFEDSKLLYERAELLFEHNNYSSAQKEFEKILGSDNFKENQKIEAQFYIGICALRLNQPETYSVDWLINFAEKKSTHPKAQYAIYEVANFYFTKKKFKQVTEYYNQISLTELEDDLRNQGRFQLAYSYFELKDYDLAEKNFDRVKNHDNKYRHAANYYSGYIKSKKEKYEEALSDFRISEQSPSYASAVPVMISNIFYKLERFDDLITYAEPIALSKKSVTNKNEIYGLLAEAYFEKLDFENAVKWYEEYTKARKSPIPSVYYKYGFSAYKLGDFEVASQQFKHVAGSTDSLGQVSAYYLGNSYLKLGKDQYALNAYNQAGVSSFDLKITQKAMFNEAKLYYKNSDYIHSAEVLKKLTSSFPNFSQLEEANDLIAESYLNSNDYEAALHYLESVSGRLSTRQKAVFQKVTNRKGIELFNQKKFKDAIAYFDKSITNNVDRDLEIESTYWKAEAYSSENEWSKSINVYARVFKLDPKRLSSYFYNSFYGIGYAYFNTQQYDKAKQKFEDFTKTGIVSSESNYYSSALVRIGDCFLVEKDFINARAKYKEAIDLKSRHSAYAKYATGLTYFYQNKSEAALEYFGDVVENHKTNVSYEKALFQKGYINLTLDNSEVSIQSFSQLIRDKPQSKSIPEAYYYRAIAYTNSKNYEEAIADYDFIITNFCRITLDGKTSLAAQAITDLERVSTEGGLTSQQYLIRLNKVSECVPSLDIELKKFELARNQLYEGLTNEAIASFEAFEVEYPNSKYQDDVKYHLGEANFGVQNLVEAKEYLEYIVENSPDNHYLESVYLLSQIALIEKDNTKIKKYNLILLKHANHQSDFLAAHINIMKSSYGLGEYKDVIKYAQSILKSESTLPEAYNEANLYQAKGYYNLKDTVRSKAIFEEFASKSKDKFGAESQYYLAKMFQDKKEYKTSTDSLISLTKKFAAEKYWVSKSYLMVGDNYELMGEVFHAMSMYESIIEYSYYEDVKQEAARKLNVLQQEKMEKDSLNIIPDTLEVGGTVEDEILNNDIDTIDE